MPVSRAAFFVLGAALSVAVFSAFLATPPAFGVDPPAPADTSETSLPGGNETERPPEPEAASSPEEDHLFEGRHSSTPTISFGGSEIVVGENETHLGDLVMFGGTADVRGEVTGSLVLFGARGHVSGHVRRDVVCIASQVDLKEGAGVGGDLVNLCGRVEKDSGVEIGRQFINLAFLNLSRFATGHSILWFFIMLAFWIKFIKAAFLFIVVAILAAVFTPRITFAARCLPQAAGRSFLFGLLTYVVGIIGCIAMALTIIGIPFAILGGITLKVFLYAGIAVCSCAVGTQVGRNLFRRTLQPFTATLSGFLLLAVLYFVPFLGGLMMGIVGLIGIGILIVTRLGTREPNGHPLAPPQFASAPAPQAPTGG